MDEENLRRNLKAVIEAKNLNMKTVSLKAELGETTVRDIIVGRTKSPTYKSIKAIAEVIGCSLDFLFSDNPNILELKNTPTQTIQQMINEELLEKCYEVVERKSQEMGVKISKKKLIKATIELYKIAVRDKADNHDYVSVGAAISIIENIKE